MTFDKEKIEKLQEKYFKSIKWHKEMPIDMVRENRKNWDWKQKVAIKFDDRMKVKYGKNIEKEEDK